MHARSADAEYQSALQFLLGRIDFERMLNMPYGRRDFRLERMQQLLERLGRPQDRLPIVHVAGTKGKGSTAAMTAAMLTAAGYRTGLYTSPHLDRLEERIAIDGQECPPEELVWLVERVRPAVAAMDAETAGAADAHGPTYFELLTALALLHFVRQRADAAVLEVGLGGRLDSTNVCLPVVSVITSISLDHTRQLGSTLAAIAREKAGIIKPGVPVISGVLDDEPREVIAEIAAERGCRLVQLDRDFRYSYTPAGQLDAVGGRPRLDFWNAPPPAPPKYGNVELQLIGEHQAANAAVALAVTEELSAQGFRLPETARRQGLAHLRWPARCEVVGRRPTVVIDAAHNVASIAALIETLEQSFQAAERRLVFATTRDKDVRGMLALLLPKFTETILTRYTNNPRGLPVEELAALAEGLGATGYRVAADPTAAWQMARAATGPEDLIAITGSFFIAAEMRTLVAALPHSGRAAGNGPSER